MPALNFKAQFAPVVACGQKTQTIRKRRKNPIKAGDTLYLKTGMRTRYCKSIGEAECTSVETIIIDGYDYVVVGANRLTMSDVYRLARSDGFNNASEFLEFFDQQYGLPFEGVLIKWESITMVDNATRRGKHVEAWHAAKARAGERPVK